MAKSKRRVGWQLAASALALSIGASLGLAQPANAIVVRDDVGVNGAVDVNNEFAGVGQMFNRQYDLTTGGFLGTFLCTGTMINPRTVVFAQHCTADAFDETFDPGVGNHMAFGFNPVVGNLAGFNAWAGVPRRNPFTGDWRSHEGLNFYNVLQVQSVFNVSEFFPGGDISIASFDTPAIGLPSYGMLFSPLLGPTHGIVNGYGTTGTGSLGDNVPIDFKRRVGENMIDGLFSQNDFIAAEFGAPGFGFGSADSAQLLYHIDFDRPDRTAGDCQRGEFFGAGNGNDIVCFTPPYALDRNGDPIVFTLDGSSGVLIGDHMNWYGGDALAREAGTAGGDSGSALFADTLTSRPLITGVLSGGWVNGVASPRGGYGDVAYYNPLFLFRDWLVENNPYVYASAREGDGRWSDPRRWVQNMDPNYFFIDGAGRVRNGLPAQAQPGYFADTPKWGTVFDTDVSGGFGDPGPDLFLCQLDPTFACPPGVSASAGLADNGLVRMDDEGGGEAGDHGPRPGPTASNGGPTGPGSRGFVPNNSFGTYGTWHGSADGTARFFDVTLNAEGRTRLDMNVEIDNLSISGREAELDVRAPFTLNALVAVDQFRGMVNVDGRVNTREYMLWGGFLTGRGVIGAETLFNVNGVISAGGLESVGSMTLNGDYVQSSLGDMLVNVRRQSNLITNDFLLVNGGASLAGDVFVVPTNGGSRARFGDVYTILHAGSVVGNFDGVALVGSGPSLFGESVVRSTGNVDIVVNARRLGQYYAGQPLQSLGQALDTLRWGGNFSNFQGLFGLVDTASFAAFDATLSRLTPANAFETVPLAVRYSQGFTQGLDMRTAELRAGVRGLSDQSVVSGMSIVGAGGAANGFTPGAGRAPTNERLGFFITGQGNFTSVGDEAYEGDRYNPTHVTAFSTSDMTAGVDFRVNEHMAVGVATTLSRYLTRDSETGVTPMDHTGYGAMLYGTAWDDAWNLDAYVGVARHEYEMARVPGQDWRNDIDAAPGAVQSLAGVRAGYSFEPISGLRIGPTVGLAYSSLDLDGYREFGAEDFALEVAGRTVDSLTAETALQFSYMLVNEAGRAPFSAFGRIGYVTELGDDIDLVSAHFVGAPGVGFGVSQMLDREWIAASTGFSYKMNENFQAFLQASSDSGRGELSNTAVQAGFTFDF